MKKYTLILLILLLSEASTILAQKKNKKGIDELPTESISSYKKITNTKNLIGKGLFNVYKSDSKYYFELSDEIRKREFLIVPRISGFVEGLKFGGAGMSPKDEYVIKWDKIDNKILLRAISFHNVASDELPVAKSVQYNNFEPIIQSFEIKGFDNDSTSVLIDVTDFFSSEIDMISPLDSDDKKNFKIKGLDKQRSLISGVKVFPENVEIRHILTFNGDNLPANESTGSISIEMNQSIVVLPIKPMKSRYGDKRVGYNSLEIIDYGTEDQRAQKKQIIKRWRLEPKDWDAYNRGELVEPNKPITYYIDPATPLKYRKYFKLGIEAWQSSFEKIGFKNAIIAKDAPTKEEDPDWSPEDVRYSVVRYITTEIVNAQGPSTIDPRSGEIIESDILWYHNVISWLRVLEQIQTGAINEKARKPQLSDEDLGEIVQYVMTHEVGHTLGMPHNMAASSAYPVDSLRSPTFTQKWGITSSIMEYARANYVAQPGDGEVHLLNDKIGPYDDYAIMYGYKPIPEAKTPDEEHEILNSWILSKASDPKYRYGQQTSTFNHPDPSAQTEDLGDDNMKASAYGLANMKRIMPHLIDWNAVPGEDYTNLKEAYNNAMSQWFNYMRHVTHNIGGIMYMPKVNGQTGDVYEFVPRNQQKEAMKFLIKEFYQDPTWLMDKKLLRKIEMSGVVNRIQTFQNYSITMLLDESKMARLIEFEFFHKTNAYTLNEMMTDLRQGLWSELKSNSPINLVRRNLQKAYLKRLEYFIGDDYKAPVVSSEDAFYMGYTPIKLNESDIKSNIIGQLTQLNKDISSAISKTSDINTKFHLMECKSRIEKSLDID